MRNKAVTALLLTVLAASVQSGCAAKREQVRQITAEEYLQQAKDLIAGRKFEKAKEIIEEARRHYRSGDADAEMLTLLGDVHYRIGEYDLAIEVYDEFLKLHPRNPLASRAQYQLGMSHFKMIRSCDRNQQPAFRAQEAFSRLLENYPHSPEAPEAEKHLAEVRRSLAEGEMFVGKFYFKKKNYHGAISRFEYILNEYPGSGCEEESLFYLGESYRRLGEEGKSLEYFKLLKERYPSGKYSRDIPAIPDERRG